MTTLNRIRPDLLLLLSLLLMILLHPLLDRGTVRRFLMELLIFVPVVLANLRLSQIKTRLWPTVLLMFGAMMVAVLGSFSKSPVLTTTKWALLAVFFAVTVVGLFGFLRH